MAIRESENEELMAATAESIETEALSLPEEERAKLVIHLLDSFDALPDNDPEVIERAWLDEAQRRLDAYRRGEVKAIPAEDVFAELQAEDD